MFLYRMADVFEMTLRALIFANSEVIESVMASARYCCCGSSERLTIGSPAMEVIGPMASSAPMVSSPRVGASGRRDTRR